MRAPPAECRPTVPLHRRPTIQQLLLVWLAAQPSPPCGLHFTGRVMLAFIPHESGRCMDTIYFYYNKEDGVEATE